MASVLFMMLQLKQQLRSSVQQLCNLVKLGVEFRLQEDESFMAEDVTGDTLMVCRRDACC